MSGGDSSSILDVMRRAMDVSAFLEMQHPGESAIDWKEAIYLGTLGGAEGKHYSSSTISCFSFLT